MNKRIVSFLNIHFNKFFEGVLNNIPPEYLRFFTPKERQTINKRRSALLKFATLEEKLYYLAKSGHRFVLVVADENKEWSSRKIIRMMRVFTKKVGFDKKIAIDELKDAGMFVLGDVDFVRSMNMLTGIYQHATLFNLVSDFTIINDKMYKYHQMHKNMMNEVSAINDVDSLISKIAMSCVNTSEMQAFETKFGIAMREFVLLAYISKNRFRSSDEISRFLTVKNASAYMADLKAKGLVDSVVIKLAEGDRADYHITGFGESVLTSCRNYFLSTVY